MPCVLDVVRATLWSELCDTDSSSYQAYLTSAKAIVEYGVGVVGFSEVDGACRLTGSSGCRIDNDFGVVGACVGHAATRFVTLVGGDASASVAVDSKDHGNSSADESSDGSSDSRARVDSSGVDVCGVSNVGGQRSVPLSRGTADDTSADGGSVRPVAEVQLESVLNCKRGKHYERNKRKREQDKRRRSQPWQQNWRRVDGSGGCVSDGSVADTVKTVDSRTAEEIEAARTLAVRRAVENKVAIAVSNAKLAGFRDKSKTDALGKLAAARMEQRINEAKAKSQASYKKCDESLKSLGSTGSAGEFALKQQVKDAKQNEEMLKYVQSQAELMARHVSKEVLDAVAAIPAPVFEVEHDVFGECPDDYDEDEAYAYDMELNRRQYEQEMRTWNPDPCPGWK